MARKRVFETYVYVSNLPVFIGSQRHFVPIIILGFNMHILMTSEVYSINPVALTIHRMIIIRSNQKLVNHTVTYKV